MQQQTYLSKCENYCLAYTFTCLETQSTQKSCSAQPNKLALRIWHAVWGLNRELVVSRMWCPVPIHTAVLYTGNETLMHCFQLLFLAVLKSRRTLLGSCNNMQGRTLHQNLLAMPFFGVCSLYLAHIVSTFLGRAMIQLQLVQPLAECYIYTQYFYTLYINLIDIKVNIAHGRQWHKIGHDSRTAFIRGNSSMKRTKGNRIEVVTYMWCFINFPYGYMPLKYKCCCPSPR